LNSQHPLSFFSINVVRDEFLIFRDFNCSNFGIHPEILINS